VERIRIVFAHLPLMLRDILRSAVAGQSDMEVVGEVAEVEELPFTLRRTAPDVVILGLHQWEVPELFTPLFDEDPWVKILAVTSDGREAVLYELRTHAMPIGEVSPQGLAKAIRAAMQANAV
jgi:DNA-binding NarL/FixJ family response regulator